jgi:hypothetical protein
MMNFSSGSRTDRYGKNDKDDKDAAAKHRLQTEMLILEGDLKKQEKVRETMLADIKKLSVEMKRMEVSLTEKKKALEKTEWVIRTLGEETKRKKRLLNAAS